MSQKTILLVLPWLPYPLISGGHQALFNGIFAIKNDFRVIVTYMATDDPKHLQDKEGFLSACPGVELVPCFLPYSDNIVQPLIIRIGSNILNCIKKSLGFVKPVDIDRQHEIYQRWLDDIKPINAQFIEHIDQILHSHTIDIIQVEMPWMLPAVLSLPKEICKVFVHHELGFVRRMLEMMNEEVNNYAFAAAKLADLNELHLMNMYDAIVTLSTVDSEKLKKIGVSSNVYSSFATVDAKTEFSSLTSDGLTLSFVGIGTHSPNSNGLLWFLTNCWAKLKAENSSYKLNVIGKWPENLIAEITGRYPGVSFLGFVDSLEDALKGTLMIVPILIGSGIRMKLLEAASIGIPFVSTSVGAEGIPFENGVHGFIADTPDEFINAILNLKSKNLQQSFADAAHQLIESSYSISALRQNRLDIYNSIFV